MQPGQQAVHHDRLEGVELQLAGLGGHGDGQVLPDDTEGDLVDELRDDRVDLARHDAGAGLCGGQGDVTEPGSGPGGQQPEVVADLGEFDRDPLEHAGEVDERAGVLGGLHQVGGQGQRDSGQLPQVPDGPGAESRVGVEPGSDGGAAQVDLGQHGADPGQPVDVLAERHRPGGQLLAQGHGYGVLQLGAAHLDDVPEPVCLDLADLLQVPELGQKRLGGVPDRDAGRGGVDVIGALPGVDVVQRVQPGVVTARVPEQFQRPVGDHLVGVHVRGGARAALDDIDGELPMQRAAADVRAGLYDGGRIGVGEPP
jgi:hypothetical protein